MKRRWIRPSTESWSSVDRRRRLGTLVVVTAAAVASIATSPPEESVVNRAEGPRVELTAEEPEITVPIEVMPNAVTEEAEQKRSSVMVQPIWNASSGAQATGGSTSTVPNSREVLELSILDEGGTVLVSGTGAHLGCNVEGCAKPAAVRFRLIDPSVGRLVLNWDFEVDYFFGEGEVPPGAEIAIEFGEADPGVTTVVVEGALSRPPDRTRYGFGVSRIQIHAPRGIPSDGEVTFEPIYATRGALLHTPEETHEIKQSVAIRLDPPQQCLTGACDWSMLLTGTQTQWQLVAHPELGIQAAVASVTPAELTSPPVSGEIDLDAGRQSRLSASVEVDRSLLSGPDFDVLGPLVAVEFRLTWEDHDVYLRTPQFDESANAPGMRVVYRPLDVVCDERACRGTAESPIFFMPEEASGAVSWEARAFVPYLITGQVPEDDGGIRLEVEQ